MDDKLNKLHKENKVKEKKITAKLGHLRKALVLFNESKFTDTLIPRSDPTYLREVQPSILRDPRSDQVGQTREGDLASGAR